LKKYRRIEVNAFRRRVTFVSGEWGRDSFDGQLAQSDDEVWLNDSDLYEPAEPESLDGHLILIDAARSLEQRLSPDVRATLYADRNILTLKPSTRDGLFIKLQSLCRLIWPRARSLARKQKWNAAEKQSVED